MGYHIRLPGTKAAPGIQDAHFQSAVRFLAFYIIVDFPEFVGNIFNVVHEFGEFVSQAQIAAVADPVYRITHKARLALSQLSMASMQGSFLS